MKRLWLYALGGLYVLFVAMDLLTVISARPVPDDILLKLLFVLGCLVWIHLDPPADRDEVDFQLIRLFLGLMFVTDTTLGLLVKLPPPLGPLLSISGTLSAAFGQGLLIARHLRLALPDRLPALQTLSPARLRPWLAGYLIVYLAAQGLLLAVGLAAGELDPLPFMAGYIGLSLVSFGVACAYLFRPAARARYPLAARRLAFLALWCLLMSDSFIGLGRSVLQNSEVVVLLVWGLYAPVLLLLGASLVRAPLPTLGRAHQPRQPMASHAGATS